MSKLRIYTGFLTPPLKIYTELRKHIHSNKNHPISKLTHFNEGAFNCVIQNEMLFTHYFHNKDKILEYFKHLLPPKYDFDFDSFVQLRRQTPSRPRQGPISHIPSLFLFGEFDPIIKKEIQEPEISLVFKNSKSQIIREVGHFPHIEKPKSFHEEIYQWFKGL